ncbi:hypothetical protein B1748_13665 [Paenibacillus sp. MY03]|nr:hypothetical protein B1748_13665 [Paenibacillus sp. MY03]
MMDPASAAVFFVLGGRHVIAEFSTIIGHRVLARHNTPHLRPGEPHEYEKTSTIAASEAQSDE